MPYGYTGQNLINQTVKNSGVFSISDVANLEKQGKFGGSLELIEEQNITTATTNVDFQTLGNYDIHFLSIENIDTDGTGERYMCARFYESGTLETASVYQYAHQYGYSNGTFGEARTTANSFIGFGCNVISTSNSRSNSYCYFYNLKNSSKYSFMTYQGCSVESSPRLLMNFGGGVLPQASEVDGIRFFLNADDITNADFKLYGIKQL